MANPIVISYSFLGADGVRGSMSVYVVDTAVGQTGTALIAGATTIGTILQNASDAKLIGGTIHIPVPPDAGWKANPVNYSQVGDAALFDFGQVNSKYKQSFVVPAIGKSLLDTANGVNLDDAAVKAFINLLVSNTGGAAAMSPVSKFDNDLNSFLGVNNNSRSHRKQMTSKTYRSGANYVP